MVYFIYVAILLIISLITIFANNAPIIGIVTMPCWIELGLCPWTDDPGSIQYFPASYVKWIESGGGRVIPIMSDAKHEEVRDLLSMVNGVLFPGINMYHVIHPPFISPIKTINKRWCSISIWSIKILVSDS